MRNIIITIITFLFISVQFSGAQSFIDENSVAIHGFASQGYMQSTDNNYFGDTENGTFKFNEFGLNITSQVTDNLRIGMQFFARNLGYLGGSEIVVDWAYGDYHWKDYLGIRAGKIKMPLGLYNEYRDIDIARVNIFMPQGVYNETWRSSFNAINGIGIYGTTPSTIIGTFDYQLQAGTFSIGQGLGKFLGDQLYANMTEYNVKTSYVANLQWETPLPGLKLSASIMLSDVYAGGITEDTEWWEGYTVQAIRGVAMEMGAKPSDPGFPPAYSDHASYEYAKAWASQGGVDIDLINTPVTQAIDDIRAYWLSAEYTYKDLVLAFEYYKLDSHLLTHFKNYPSAFDREIAKNEMGGFYGSAIYRFTDWFQAGAYYSEYYPDLGDKDGKGYNMLYGFPPSNGWLKDTALSLRFDLNTNWIAKVEGHKMNGTAVMFRSDQVNPNDMKEDWYLGAVKLTFSF